MPAGWCVPLDVLPEVLPGVPLEVPLEVAPEVPPEVLPDALPEVLPDCCAITFTVTDALLVPPPPFTVKV